MPHENAPAEITGPLAELRWWPWVKQAKYPHLRPEEASIMDRLIEQTPGLMISVCYDVAVGPNGCVVDPGQEQLARLADTLTRCRIDAIAWDGEQLWIIELKTYALPNAVGQILMYRCLLPDDLPEDLPLATVIVCNAVHQAAISCAARANVLIVIPGSEGLEVIAPPQTV